MNKKSLIIIGAGASGLMAAKELSGKFHITILEASLRIGGRINSIQIQNDIIEAGPEFIHWHLPLTFKLLKRSKIKAVPVEGKFYRKKSERFIEQDEIPEGWNELLKKMKAVKEDMTMYRFLEKFYPGNSNQSFRKMVNGYTEGFDIADPTKVSVQSLYKEWSSEEGINYKIPTGYLSLMEYLKEEANCTILTGKKIKKVRWEPGHVTAFTTGDEAFHSDKVLITVPVSILQNQSAENSIHFAPSINEYIQAANNIEFGAVIKTVIKFKDGFWQKDAAFFFSEEEYFPTWCTQFPGSPIITGWTGGPKASILASENNDVILLKAVKSLSIIFNKNIEDLQGMIIYAEVFNWQKEPFAFGAYSYNTIYSETAKKVLNTAVSNTVFFAGEALYSGNYPGTVEAALQSGKSVAKQIKKAMTS